MIALLIVPLSAWTLWHDVGIFYAPDTRVGGSEAYAVKSYETEGDCRLGKAEAMANEELPRRGPLTRRIANGIMVWDLNRIYYTTFLYRCTPTGAD